MNGVKFLKIVFLGTPEFAVPSLEMLVKEGYEIAAVITQPDKPKGRGNKLTAPPIKEFAMTNGIKVLQPPKVRTSEFFHELQVLAPDLLVTVAYGKILPVEVLDLPKFGCINVHGSLLPKYRGAAPIHWAIINGEKVTGITTMYTDVGMDTGDMLIKKEIDISEDITVGELHDEMAVLGAEVLKGTLINLVKGTLMRVPQIDNESTYAPIIKKELGEINWNKASVEIHNLVRGTNPWPGAFTTYKSERMRVWKTKFQESEDLGKKPGIICKVSDEGIIVSTGSGFITITEIQFDSGKKMGVEEYIRGHNLEVGTILV